MSRSFILSVSAALSKSLKTDESVTLCVMASRYLCLSTRLQLTHPDYIKHREPPLCTLFVPNSPHFAVVKESYRYFLYLAHCLIIVYNSMSIPNRDSGCTHIEKLYHSFLRAPHCFIIIYHLVWIDVEIESLSKILATLTAQKSICTMSTLEP